MLGIDGKIDEKTENKYDGIARRLPSDEVANHAEKSPFLIKTT